MLPLESQVISLEYAKRLREFGVKQEGLFCWSRTDGFKNWRIELHSSEHKPTGITQYCAFTVAEILQLLPATVTIEGKQPYDHFRLAITNASLSVDTLKFERNFIFNYECTSIGNETNWCRANLTSNIFDKNPANAAAKMLTYLLENNIVKVEDINSCQ